jgi:hypothetical protein
MPALSLHFISGFGAAILNELTAGLGVGDSRKLDRGLGFMAVHVECLHDRPGVGPLFSVAHYYEQSGDLVPDPDVVFVRSPQGWSPVSFQNSMAYRVAVTFHDDGTIEVDAKEQSDLVSFCNVWMRNIQQQQGLSPRKRR